VLGFINKIINSTEISEVESLIEDFFYEEKIGTLVLTKKSKDSEFFEEFLTLGYNEESFYYEFLSREKGFLNQFFKSNLPIKILGEEYRLYLGKESKAVFFRIQKEFPLGFIFLESRYDLSDEQVLGFQTIASKLAELFFLEYSIQAKIKGNLFDIILESSVGMRNSIIANKFIFIQGSEGTGKKLLVEKIHEELNLEGKIFYEYSLPETEQKIRESLVRAFEISKNGLYVFLDIEKTTKLQQEIFHSYLIRKEQEPRFIFISSKFKFKEESKLFWDLVRTHLIHLPDLIELSFTKLKKLIDFIVYEESKKLGKGKIQIEELVYMNLFQRNYKQNLSELKKMIGEGVSNLKDSILNLESFRDSSQKEFTISEKDDLDLRKATQNLERELILIALKKYNNNQVKMAKALGISRGSLQYKLKQLGVGNEMG
jgi:hypothetical protein